MKKWYIYEDLLWAVPILSEESGPDGPGDPVIPHRTRTRRV